MFLKKTDFPSWNNRFSVKGDTLGSHPQPMLTFSTDLIIHRSYSANYICYEFMCTIAMPYSRTACHSSPSHPLVLILSDPFLLCSLSFGEGVGTAIYLCLSTHSCLFSEFLTVGHFWISQLPAAIRSTNMWILIEIFRRHFDNMTI